MFIANPVKFTPEVSKKLEEAAALDCAWEEIAFFAGISKVTLYNWLESIDGLRERLNELKQEPFLKARRTVVSNLDSVQGAQWYLERKKKNEFAQRSEHTGADGKDLPTPILANLDVHSDNSDKEDSETTETN